MPDQMNPLLQTLYVIRDICDSPQSAADLCQRYGFTTRTLRRHVKSARSLGADLRSQREGSSWLWYCDNADQIKASGRVARWIELEEAHNVT